MAHISVDDVAHQPAIDAKYFLIGDIGGTNLRIELLSADHKVIKKVVVPTNNYKSLSQFLHEFFKDCEVQPN